LSGAGTTLSRALAFVGVLVLCAACADNHVAPIPPRPHIDAATQMPALERQIFVLVQDERRRIDPAAKPLTRDAELQGIAEARSADMARNNYIAHTSPDGVTAAGLLMDEDAKFQGLLGENLAVQPIAGDSGVDVPHYARRIVDTWLASSAHRDNLAFAGYDRSAVAAAVGGQTIYVIQLFATDLGLSSISRKDSR
jgi:uncharacterized protein YkwD